MPAASVSRDVSTVPVAVLAVNGKPFAVMLIEFNTPALLTICTVNVRSAMLLTGLVLLTVSVESTMGTSRTFTLKTADTVGSFDHSHERLGGAIVVVVVVPDTVVVVVVAGIVVVVVVDTVPTLVILEPIRAAVPLVPAVPCAMVWIRFA